MHKKNFNKGPRSPRPQRAEAAAMGSFDFGPMMPFLRERLPDNHPVYLAAMANNLAHFMAALRDVGDGQLNHDIASELERMSRPTPSC